MDSSMSHVISAASFLTPGRPVLITLDRSEVGHLASQFGAKRCKPLQMVAGGRFELYNTFPIRVPAVPASIVETR
jgi:hypothetical protein